MTQNNSSYKLRLGIVGTNTISDKIVAASRFEPRIELSAVYSRTEERGTAFAQKHDIPYIYTDLQEMASGDRVDAVYIASPTSCHAGQSILCMRESKHVLCEKPLASNSREAEEMIAVARENGVVLMEAMKPTLTPNFDAIREGLERIGTIRRYVASYCQYSSRYDRLKQGIIDNAWRPELSNGAVMDLGVYTIYPMVVLFGMPERISASGLLLSTGVDGQGAANFEYPGTSATVIYSKIVDSEMPTEIQGEEGTITIDRINAIGRVELKLRNGEKTTLSRPPVTNEYYYELCEFVDLVEQGRSESTVNSLKNSLTTMRILDEIRRQVMI